MKRKVKIFNLPQQRGSGPEQTCGGMDATVELRRLRNAQERIEEIASQIPPLSAGQVHDIIGGRRQTQFQLRRQCDRYLLLFCLSFLALVATILWLTAPAGVVPLNVALLVLVVVDCWVALRAAQSLWLMRQTQRHRHSPYRMSRYADRLSRLSRRRRLWLGFILRNSYDTSSDKRFRRLELVCLRIPSYAIAACLLLLVALNASKVVAVTHDFVNVTTTSDKTDQAICQNVQNLIAQS